MRMIRGYLPRRCWSLGTGHLLRLYHGDDVREVGSDTPAIFAMRDAAFSQNMSFCTHGQYTDRFADAFSANMARSE
jgi:hypothetical protein